MILSDRDILKGINNKEIKIIPFEKKNLGPCSVDLTLDSKITKFKGKKILYPEDISMVKEIYKVIKIDQDGYVIKPNEFILGMTKEKIAISKKLAATLEGRSSLARIGIVVHAAGLVNPGTGSRKPIPLALEISNRGNTPVKLKPGIRIIQIIFHRLTSEAKIGYDERPSSRYVGLDRPLI